MEATIMGSFPAVKLHLLEGLGCMLELPSGAEGVSFQFFECATTLFSNWAQGRQNGMHMLDRQLKSL